jgi:hypothetical protein
MRRPSSAVLTLMCTLCVSIEGLAIGPGRSCTSAAHFRCKSPAMRTVRRGEVISLSGLSFIFSRLATLVLTRDSAKPLPEPTWDPVAAAITSRAAGQCPLQSCADARLTELKQLLDTTKVETDERGIPVEVYVQPTFGARGPSSRAAYRIVVAVAAADARLLWLKNADTGEIIATKAIEVGAANSVPTLVASLLEPYAGVRRGSNVTAFAYFADAGISAVPFQLCATPTGAATEPNQGQGAGTASRTTSRITSSSSCPSFFGPTDFFLDTRGRRASSDVGAELLTQASAIRRCC